MNFYKKLLTIFFIAATTPCYALSKEAVVEKINFDDKNNVEISIDAKTPFKAYGLHDPERLVVDIENAVFGSNSQISNFPTFVSGFRKGKSQNNLRLVFDFNVKVAIRSSVFHKLKKDKLGRIIVKIEPDSSDNSVKDNGAKIIKTSLAKNPVVAANKTPIIVIDAGHGGKDPGTIGDYARTKEKNITLSYARELGKHLLNTKRYKVYLIRDSDSYVSLKGRVAKARRLHADLFISLHANAAADRNVSGFSIYTLSEKSSDRQAELLAQKENRADIIAGINFGNTSGDILTTLIDLSQRSSMNSSSHFANIAIKSVQKSGVKILQNTHRFAGFAVLTAPDMTSILIELGYLSNRGEESKLNNLTHKRRIIQGLVDSIDEYFRN